MAGSHADVSRQVKTYLVVFAALAVFTIATVATSRVDFGGSVNIVIALVIAALKATLVAAIFMHLKWERSRAIWMTLAFCAVFFLVLILLPVLSNEGFPAAATRGTWG